MQVLTLFLKRQSQDLKRRSSKCISIMSRNVSEYTWFLILTPITMKSSIFWNITLCSPVKFKPCFEGTCRLLLHARNESHIRNQHETNSKYSPEDAADIFPETSVNFHRNTISYARCYRSEMAVKIYNFWDIMPCSPVKANRPFGWTYRLLLQRRRVSQVRKAWSREQDESWRWRQYIPSGTSTDFQRTTRRYISEDRTPHSLYTDLLWLDYGHLILVKGKNYFSLKQRPGSLLRPIQPPIQGDRGLFSWK
jgi:hypothetical protein